MLRVRDLHAALDRLQVGEAVTVTVVRKGQRHELRVTLQGQQ